MTSTRRIFVLAFTLLPLLAAQCWGLCGLPSPASPAQQEIKHQTPPCHNVPNEPAKSAPAPCCVVTATFDLAPVATHDFSPDPAWVQPISEIAPLIAVAATTRIAATTAPPSPPARQLVLRV